MALDRIIVQGAREHNLKNISLEIPREKLVVITGLSGSGKSSLAFDTIYAEGQRRYVESLSAYARQFLGQMEKPDVDSIDGLSPAIAIEQKSSHRNPRSTVGTVTEIYDYLRLLYARIGKAYCPSCSKPIQSQSVDQIINLCMAFPEGRKLQILSPIVRGRKGEFTEILEKIRKEGFVRVRIDGAIFDLQESSDFQIQKNKKHNIDIIIDRLIIKEGVRARLADSIEIALDKAGGNMLLLAQKEGSAGEWEEKFFSTLMSCHECGISFPVLEPRSFSFNSPHGACQECDGLGVLLDFDPQLIVTDSELSVLEGAVRPWGTPPLAPWYQNSYRALARHYQFKPDLPWKKLPKKYQEMVLFGNGDEKILYKWEDHNRSFEMKRPFEGVIPNLRRRYKETKSESMREEFDKYITTSSCHACKGERLQPFPAAVRISEKTITEISDFSISDALYFFNNLLLDEVQAKIARDIIKEIKNRLSFLENVGLSYLTMSRAAGTLSGGEAQRIRLATQIGSQLMGVLYILDEPSIGLHQRDNDKLLATLKGLRDLGNTVLVVEHDQDTMEQSDYIIDLGPGAGIHGGFLVAFGTPNDIKNEKKSLTGQYLRGDRKISQPENRRKGTGKFIEIIGARENNLKNLSVKIPLGEFVCITGVSGSGKSTLINEILYKRSSRILMRSFLKEGKVNDIKGLEYLDKVIDIDQSPIGRTPRSNPATYTGLFTPIRDMFARLPESKLRGYQSGRFSFNVKGGRCETCEGDGIKRIEMHFLPDVYVTCEVCHGKRYNQETLEVRYKGKSIYDILEMNVEEALTFFEAIPSIKNKLLLLSEVGLDYIKLGQAATTLSGGEAQRIKLSTELAKRSTGKTLYILDEPTTGLHFEDIRKLLIVLNRLVDQGNTVVIIEHNLDVIKNADWIIDLGPEGGEKGGTLVCCGTPEDVAAFQGSYTGHYLKKILR